MLKLFLNIQQSFLLSRFSNYTQKNFLFKYKLQSLGLQAQETSTSYLFILP